MGSPYRRPLLGSKQSKQFPFQRRCFDTIHNEINRRSGKTKAMERMFKKVPINSIICFFKPDVFKTKNALHGIQAKISNLTIKKIKRISMVEHQPDEEKALNLSKARKPAKNEVEGMKDNHEGRSFAIYKITSAPQKGGNFSGKRE
ncbi:hypothetical protein PIB30_063652 [Stylosanthes scabra]|uniref:Uncharacterized protein n=1 Tax=Stylosanthes scabra TaxID=79078 RepID=A0ABU6XMU9_9FABA|nr:hypothetical protein [Stylosanthes scabra]